MATIPSPRTWVAGEKVTAALLNAQLRDAVNFLLNPPSCHVYHNTTQNITSGITTWQTLSMNSESWDTDGMHSTVTSNSRITIVTAGIYDFFGNISFATETTNANRGIRFLINGTTGGPSVKLRNTDANITSMDVAGRLDLAAGDYVELQAVQDSGVTISATGGEFATFMTAKWVATG